MKVVEFYALWLAALESGEYSQGSGYLQANGKFCCMGVAGDLLVKQGFPGLRWEVDPSGISNLVLHDPDSGDCGTLPSPLSQALGLISFSRPGVRQPHSLQFKLMTMNDRDGKTFPEIAAYIRQEILPKIDPNLELELK